MLPIFALWVFLLQNQYSKKNKNITALSLLELVGFFFSWHAKFKECLNGFNSLTTSIAIDVNDGQREHVIL